jgi:hypothetical protein
MGRPRLLRRITAITDTCRGGSGDRLGKLDAIMGIEVYDLGAGDMDLKLPVPTSIRAWEKY